MKQTVSENRNYGIDALRLFSMFLVVILHVLGRGGILGATNGGKLFVCMILETAAFCSVDCFALISGYVSYSGEEKPFRYSKYIHLWLQVVFYSFGFTLLAWICGVEGIGIKTLILSALPVASGHYWYFSAYTGLFFLIPWLNRFVRSCSRTEMTRFILILFLLFSCYAIVARRIGMPFSLDDGYSFPWLVILYLMGAWMKKCAVPERVKAWHAGVCMVVCIAGALFCCYCLNAYMLSYINPLVLLTAAALIVLFARMKVGTFGRKALRFLAPASFGIYLVHLQSVVWQWLNGRFAWIAGSPAWLIPVQVLGCAAAVFAVCLLTEKIRELLFRILWINAAAEKLARIAERRIAACVDRIAGDGQ